MTTRGIRNKNPFNVRYTSNGWLGKVKRNKKDPQFEEFSNMAYGIRCGILLLRGYIFRGYDTLAKIINRFAPASENDVMSYITYICDNNPLLAIDKKIEVNSIEFFLLCRAICKYESKYDLDLDTYNDVKKKFHII